MSTARLDYLRRTMRQRICDHRWVDETRFGDAKRRLFCYRCERRREEER